MPRRRVPPTEPIETTLARFRETGDPDALADVFDRTADGLFRLALAWTPDAALAEDALQETFLAVIAQVRRWDPSRPAFPWLVGILHHKASKVRRAARRSPDPFRLPPPLAAVDPAVGAGRTDDVERVRAAIAALPEAYRAVAVMRWRYGLEPVEIAEIRGEPPGTVRSTLSRALARLRRDLRSAPVVALLGPGALQDGRAHTAVRRAVLRALAERGAATVGCGLGAAGVSVATLLAFPMVGGAWVAKKTLAAAVVAIVATALWLRPCGETGHDAPPSVRSAPGIDVGNVDATPRPRARADASPAVAPPTEDGRVVDVTVQVVTGAGDPIDGALVEVFRAPRGSELRNADLRRGDLPVFDAPRTERTATTGLNGAASFRLAASRGWAFSASKEGFGRNTTNTPGSGPGVDLSHAGDRETIVLRLVTECVLTGRVRDENGHAVAGVVVAVVPGTAFEYGGVRAVRAITASDGRYSLQGLSPGAARVHAARDGQSVSQAEVRLPYAADFDLVARSAGYLVGRVLDAADGKPVGGAVVRASTAGFAGIVEATSAEDGSYRLPWCLDQPVGHLVAERVGFTTAPQDARVPPEVVRRRTVPHASRDGRQVLALAVPAGTEVREDVLLVRAGRVHGVVRGPDGPLAGVQITATTGREQDAVWVAPTVSGADGRYELTSVPGGAVLLHAALEGFYAADHPRAFWREALRAGAKPTPWRIEVAAGGDTEHDIVLTRGVPVEGLVVTQSGVPIEGAVVHTFQDDSQPLTTSTNSNVDGTFRLDGVAPDRPAFVWATAPAWCLDEGAVEVDPKSDDRVVLRMAPPVRVAGTVTDSDGSLPPAGTAVTVSIEVEPNGRGGRGIPDFAPTAPVENHGRFEILVRTPRAARLRVTATAPGRDDAQGRALTVEEWRSGATVDLRFPPRETVRGRVVVRGSTVPVPDATVRSQWAAGPPVARTLSDGTFVIEGRDPNAQPNEPRRIFVTAEGFALGRGVVPTGGGEIAVELDPVLDATGTVQFADGTAAAGVLVSAERQAAIEGSWYEFGEPGVGPFRSEATTDGRGSFRLRGLPAGRYVALARPPADGSVGIQLGRSAAFDAGARGVVVVVERPADAAPSSSMDAFSDGDLGREAIVRLMRNDPAGAAAAWEALLARPLADDARAEALGLYANGPLRALGRRDDAARALDEAVRLVGAGSARLATLRLNLATVLFELGRFADAIPVARDAAASSAGKDSLVNALARLREAQSRARLGETDAAREEFVRLRDEAGNRRDGGWPSVRAMAEAELRR